MLGNQQKGGVSYHQTKTDRFEGIFSSRRWRKPEKEPNLVIMRIQHDGTKTEKQHLMLSSYYEPVFGWLGEVYH